MSVSPLFPIISTCPSVRLEPWSAKSMRMAAARSLKTACSSLSLRSSGRTRSDIPNPASSAAMIIDQNDTPSRPGKINLWSGATHANLVGMLAFGRFQSTVPASKDIAPPISETPATSGVSAAGAHDTDSFATDAATASATATLLFNGWMASVEPVCVETFLAVEACAGGYDRGHVEVTENHGPPLQATGHVSWRKVKDLCFRAIAEDGRGPRGASLEEVLLLYKHLCRLGCRRRVFKSRISICRLNGLRSKQDQSW